MRIKDYAESKNISYQAVYKKIRSAKYKERLKDHLYLDNEKVENIDLIGIKILEDYAFEKDIMTLEAEKEDLHKQLKECNQYIAHLEHSAEQYQEMIDKLDSLLDRLLTLYE